MTLHDRLVHAFRARFGTEPGWLARAPGRVNLIGEHTDYNDGFAMPMAIDQETAIAFRPGGKTLRVVALDFEGEDVFAPDMRPAPSPCGWANYVRGVVDELVKAGVAVPGGDLAIAGNIARGTGLSSSASLEVAVAGILLAAAGESWSPVDIALLGQRAECDFVGVRCGNLDQLAVAATQRDHALLIDCRNLALRHITLPSDMVVMIVQSGVIRGLLDGEYNQRRQECEAAARLLGVAALRDADDAMLDAAAARMSDQIFRRARHVISENRRTLEAARAVAAGDLAAMGRLMRESHASQRDDFGITVPQTDQLADVMNAAIGAEGGARQTGGGFGGAVIALLPADRRTAVEARVRESYRTPDGTPADISVVRPALGLSVTALG
jgi:galactokinase